MSVLIEFFQLRRMWTPALVRVILVVLVGGSVFVGTAVAVAGAIQHDATRVAVGAALAIVGPPLSRLYCEVMILPFRVYDLIGELTTETREQTLFVAMIADSQQQAANASRSTEV
jgi:hypothetical protein